MRKGSVDALLTVHEPGRIRWASRLEKEKSDCSGHCDAICIRADPRLPKQVWFWDVFCHDRKYIEDLMCT